MHDRNHVVVRRRGRCGLDVGGQVRPLAGRVACFGHLHLVADPGHVAFVPCRVAGDKGHSSPMARSRLRRRHIRPVIPSKSNQRRHLHLDREAYQRRNRIETAMVRHKASIGSSLRARTLPAQKTETRVACLVLNRTTRLGRPVSLRIC